VLIQGNHDRPSDLQHFKNVHDIAEVEIGGQRIVMCHYAMNTWNHSFRGAWQIHGHSHGTLTPNYDRKICDIGVDSWGYKPVTFHQLQAQMRMHGRETVDDLNNGFTTTYGKEADLLATPK
jgi:calcineurin-like phosphoesterase family protein